MDAVKVLIVEDEILIAEDLKDNLVSFGLKNIEMAHDKESALQTIASFNPDVILLDVRMENEKDGIEIGEFLLKQNKKSFIYITAHSDVDMIRQIVKTQPAGYITKPFKKSDLFAAISLVLEQAKKDMPSTLLIKDGYANVKIPTENILYIESEGNYINIFCEDKKYVARQSLDSVIAELNPADFYRIHRSYLVNTAKITKFSKKEILIGTTTLPVSRNVADAFETYMLKSR